MIDRTIGGANVANGAVSSGVMSHPSNSASLFSQSFKAYNSHDMVRLNVIYYSQICIPMFRTGIKVLIYYFI